MTELATLPARTSRSAALPPASETQRYWLLAEKVCTTDMVPSDFRGNAAATLACALAGREIGLGFFEALRSFYVVDGKPSESAELLHTLALRAGHDIYVVESTSRACRVLARHRDWPEDRPPLPVDWTLEDACAAELYAWDCLDVYPRHKLTERTKQGRNGSYKVTTCGCKDNWRKYARAMLRSRCISEAVRAVAPEVTVGATYTAEELGAPVSGPGGRPDGAARGWGASGDSFALPDIEDVDGMWVASHTVDQVLSLVDHYDADTIVQGAGDVPLGMWVKRCELSGEKRPRLLEGLDARLGVIDVSDSSDQSEGDADGEAVIVPSPSEQDMPEPERQPDPEPQPQPDPEPEPEPEPKPEDAPDEPPERESRDATKDAYVAAFRRLTEQATTRDDVLALHRKATEGLAEGASFDAAWEKSSDEARQFAVKTLTDELCALDAPADAAPSTDPATSDSADDGATSEAPAGQRARGTAQLVAALGASMGTALEAADEYRSLRVEQVADGLRAGDLDPADVALLEAFRPGGPRKGVTQALPARAIETAADEYAQQHPEDAAQRGYRGPAIDPHAEPSSEQDERAELLAELERTVQLARAADTTLGHRAEARRNSLGDLDVCALDTLRAHINAIKAQL